MDDLIAFITARLDEDELAARNAGGEPWDFTGINCEVRVREGGKGYGEFGRIIAYCRHGNPVEEDLALAIHISNNDPARVLREAEAKRQRLALLADATAEMDKLLADKHAGRVDQAMAIGRARAAAVAVKQDAAVWNDHPDYRAKWAP